MSDTQRLLLTSATERPLRAKSGHYNVTVGRVEAWPRCVYCHTHVLAHHGAETVKRCDCGKTRLVSEEVTVNPNG